MTNRTESEDAQSGGGERPRSGRSRSSSRQLQPSALLQDVDRLWDSFVERFGAPGWPFQNSEQQRLAPFGQRPRVDVAERGDRIVVTAEVPGLKREDLDIELTNDTLTLRAQQSSDTETERGGFHRREIVRGSFVRHIRLPCPVAVEHANADYRDGLLTVTLPKTEQARSRKIPLSSAGESRAAPASDDGAATDTTH